MTKLSGLRRPLLDTPTVPAAPEGEVVVVPMTAVDRRRVRRRVRAPDGAELRLALPTGTVLTPGTRLEVRDGVTYVVGAVPEDVAVIRPRSMPEAAAVAHAVGNLHRDIIAADDPGVFLVLWDAPMELLLTRLGVPYAREQRPFHGRPAWEHAQ
ncbi:urease accessory protein [Deinococcus metalli]|uniref:Urease accessory protein n=1 Tax=Deinococcus metalli TaxID=1141878 RepID=A0A7W8NQC2_9DEIO|nr:urease accessory protein UreE [Deinococcus metalli]MBB5375708.1 urease accessory protein [Deinococcus metalli]GHF37628.1 urease accessory protein UreE [Deinococcus metalli]